MSVAKRKRRKITVNGRPYVWYLRDDRLLGEYRLPDGRLMMLMFEAHIISEDKKFNVSYVFSQQGLPEPFVPRLFVLGRDFPGLASPGKWIETPRWDDSKVSAQFIHDLIAWCMDENKKIVEVDKYGKPLVDSA
jgi:hypothetical protein